MADTDLVFGEEVIFPWASGMEVRGTVREVYGIPPRLYVVINLTPELSEIVVEPTTVVVPAGEVKKVAPAT